MRGEHRVRGERGVPRRERERMAEPHRRVGAERNVLLVEREAVQARDAPHAAARLGHHLRPDPVAGEAGDRIGGHDTVTSWTSSWIVTAPPVSASALKRANARELVLVELAAPRCAGTRERVPPGVLAERQRHLEPELARVDDLVGRDVLQQPVLVDPGLVGERVRAHDRLVRRDGVAREPLDEARGGADLERSTSVCACRASPRMRIAITISSSAALPARSPMPFTVHSTCCTPASTPRASSRRRGRDRRGSGPRASRPRAPGRARRTSMNAAYSCGSA